MPLSMACARMIDTCTVLLRREPSSRIGLHRHDEECYRALSWEVSDDMTDEQVSVLGTVEYIFCLNAYLCVNFVMLSIHESSSCD